MTSIRIKAVLMLFFALTERIIENFREKRRISEKVREC